MPPDFGGYQSGHSSSSNEAAIRAKQQADADRIHQSQLREQLENRLRIRKGSKLDKERLIHDIDRDVVQLGGQLHHIEMEEKRLSEEVRKMSQEIKQEVGEKKNLDMGLRDTAQSLSRKEEEMRRLDREIETLQRQIEEKKREIAAIKEDTRHLARDKEEFRRSGELEHFTVKSEEGHLHEVQVKLQLLSQDKLRKENELKHKEDQQKVIHREINFMDQEISQLEVELQRVRHPGAA